MACHWIVRLRSSDTAASRPGGAPSALFWFEAAGPQPRRGQGELTWSSSSPSPLATVPVVSYVFNRPVGATRLPGALGWQVVLDSWGHSPMVIRSWEARLVPSSAQQGRLLGGPGRIRLGEHLLSPGSQLRARGPTARGLPGDLLEVLAWPGITRKGLHLLEQQRWGPWLSEASRPLAEDLQELSGGPGHLFPGHKQKQRSGPFSRELPGSWEHGGACQASPKCHARQLAGAPTPPLGSVLQRVLSGRGSAQEPAGCCSQLFGRSNVGC